VADRHAQRDDGDRLDQQQSGDAAARDQAEVGRDTQCEAAV